MDDDQDLDEVVIQLRGSNISDSIFTIANRIRDMRRPGVTAPQVSPDRKQGRITITGMKLEAIEHAMQKAMNGMRGLKWDLITSPNVSKLNEHDAAVPESSVAKQWQHDLRAKERELENQRIGYETELSNLRKDLEKAQSASRALFEINNQLDERIRKQQEDYDKLARQVGESVQSTPTSLSESVNALTELALADVTRLNNEIAKHVPNSGSARVALDEAGFTKLLADVSKLTGKPHTSLSEARTDLENYLKLMAPEAEEAKKKEDDARQDLKTIEELDAGRMTLSAEIERLVRAKIDVDSARETLAKAEETRRAASAGEELRRRIDEARAFAVFQERTREAVAEWGRRHSLVIPVGIVADDEKEDQLMVQVRVPAVHADAPLARELKRLVDEAFDRKEYKEVKWEEVVTPKWAIRNGRTKTGRDIDAFKAAAILVDRINRLWSESPPEQGGVPLRVLVYHDRPVVPTTVDASVVTLPETPVSKLSLLPPAAELPRGEHTTGVRRAK